MIGHPGHRRVYDTLTRMYCWQHMASNVYTLIAKCESCVRNGNRYRHKRPLRLFPAFRRIDFNATDILGRLPKTIQGNQYISVMTDRNFKLARAIPTSSTLSTHKASIFYDHRIVSFDVSTYLLTKNELQFVIILFTTVCGYLSEKHLPATMYHSQTSGQAKQFN